MGLVFRGEAEKKSGNVFPPAHCMDTPDDGLHQYKAHANAELQDSGNSRISDANSNTVSRKELIGSDKVNLWCYSFQAIHYEYL